MDNPEKLATLGTQDTGRRQTKQKTPQRKHGPYKTTTTTTDFFVTPTTRRPQWTSSSRLSLDISKNLLCLFIISLLPAVQSDDICEDRTKLMQVSKSSSSAGTGIALQSGL